MKELLPLVRSYIKNSSIVLNNLRDILRPEGTLLISADAKSMYTNIDTHTGVSSIYNLITNNTDSIAPGFPTDLFLKILSCIMENNIFTFADTHWLQLSGTAMGTPAACAYATISFGQHENVNILPNFQPQLLYYKRYIDNIFGIWVPPPRNNKLATWTWNAFKAALNSWGKLEWIIEEPSLKTTFLDLNIAIEGPCIVTSPFQKSMNLYLCIPPTSANLPCCFKGLITGELRRYFIQNDKEGFEKILTKFINRLLDRGHSLNHISPLLHQAAAHIDNRANHDTSRDQKSTLYLHWPFHPKGLQRQHLRQLYDSTLKDILPFEKMQVAIS
jgi:hypothetical protein